MFDFLRRRLPEVITAVSLMLGVVLLALFADPIAGLALLSLVVGFLVRVVCQIDRFRHGP